MREFNTALKTRINTREALARLQEEELPDIMKQIAAASQRGDFETHVQIKFGSTVSELEELGYKVNRDDYFIGYLINWE